MSMLGISLLVVFLAIVKSQEWNHDSLLVESISHRMLQRQLGEAADTKIEGTSGKLFKGEVIRKYNGQLQFKNLNAKDLPKRYKEAAAASKLKSISDRKCSQWAVVTTINDPTEAVERQAQEEDWCLVVIGDRKGPRSYDLPKAVNWTVFLDDKAQETFVGDHPIGKLLPWNHFGRKNLGFIFAILHGAHAIFDFDDDNMLLDVPSNNPTKGHIRGSNAGQSEIHGRKLPNAPNTVSHHHLKDKYSGKHSGPADETKTEDESAASTTVAAHSDTKRNEMKKVLVVPGSSAGDALYTVNIPFNYNFTLLNPYPLMGASASPAWPRGYPLNLIKSTYHQYTSSVSAAAAAGTAHHEANNVNNNNNNGHNNFVLNKVTVAGHSIGVVQYLAGHDPDVDAIYRLIQPLPLNFALHQHPLMLPLHNVNQQQVYCPYNAQATMHTYAALWTLLLPITVHGRVSDIWRSYFAQRLMADVDLSVVFHPPYVVQYRNSHNYLADFDSEGPLYLEAGMLVEQLSAWYSCAETLVERMESLWVMLFERGYIQEADVNLLQVWLQTLLEVQYQFPEIKHSHPSCHKK